MAGTVLWKNDCQIPVVTGAAISVTSGNSGDGTHDAIAATSATGGSNLFESSTVKTFGADNQCWHMTQGSTSVNIQYLNLSVAQTDFTHQFELEIDGTSNITFTTLRYYTDTAHTVIAFTCQYTSTRHLSIAEQGQATITSTTAMSAGVQAYYVVRYVQATNTASITAYARGTTTVLATVSTTMVAPYSIAAVRLSIGNASSGVGDMWWSRIQMGGGGAIPREDLSAVAPVANAGPDQTGIPSGNTCNLDGTASSFAGGTITGYAWTQTAGTAVTLAPGSTDPQPTFTAPNVASNTTLTFSLTVTGDNGQTGTDTVNIGIVPVGPPTAIVWANDCQIPAATGTGTPVNAGDSGDVTHSAIGINSSTGSGNLFNAVTGVGFGTDTQSWKMTQGGANLNIQYLDWTTGQADFTHQFAWMSDTAPGVTFTFLRYYDDIAHTVVNFTGQFTTTRHISLAENGQSTITSSGTLTLNQKYYMIFRYIAATNTATLTAYRYGTTTADATVTVTVVGAYTINSLRLSIGQASVVPGNVYWSRIQVASGGSVKREDLSNVLPVANAGGDQLLIEPVSTVSHSASGSSDVDGTIVSYSWAQIAGTTVAITGAASVLMQYTSPMVISGDTLTFRVTVTDNDGGTGQDTVSDTILPHTIWRKSAGGTLDTSQTTRKP